MLKRRFLPLGVLGVIAAVGSFLAVDNLGTVSPGPKLAGHKTQVDSQAGVTVEAKPVQLVGGREAIFSVSLDTHTVDLNFDLTYAITLEDDRGDRYQAINWTGGKGGHHLEGKIIFPKIKKETKMANLIINELGGEERKFSWEL